MVWNILTVLLFGLVAGLIARFLVPGRDPMGLLGTIVLGVAGSFLGGFLYNYFLGAGDDLFGPSGWIGSIGGAIVLLILMRLFGLRGGDD